MVTGMELMNIIRSANMNLLFYLHDCNILSGPPFRSCCLPVAPENPEAPDKAPCPDAHPEGTERVNLVER